MGLLHFTPPVFCGAHVVSESAEAASIRILTFFRCSGLLVVSVGAGGSGDAVRFRADTFWGPLTSSTSKSSTVALRGFFDARMGDFAFEEAKAELICRERVVNLVRLALGAVFEGSMSAIWVQ